LRGWRVICGAAVYLLKCHGIPRTPVHLQVAKIVSVAIQAFEDCTSVNLCDVRNGTILRSSHSSKVKADSERQSQPSYLRLIITFGLSLTVSELLAFVWTENDVMPIFPLGGVVGQISRRILKGSIRLPIRY